MEKRIVNLNGTTYTIRVGNIIDGGVRSFYSQQARDWVEEKLKQNNCTNISELPVRLQVEYLVRAIHAPAFIAVIEINGVELTLDDVFNLSADVSNILAQAVLDLNPGWLPVSVEAEDKEPTDPFGSD